jgi:hypothetical protein
MNNDKMMLQIREELCTINKQKSALLEELKILEQSSVFIGALASCYTVSSPLDKVALFLRLFRTRCDVLLMHGRKRKVVK